MKKTLLTLTSGGFILLGFIIPKIALAVTEAARVNDSVITLEDVNTRLSEATKSNPLNVPTKKAILEDLIKREAILQEARKMKLEQSPAVIERFNNVLYGAYIEKKLQGEFDKMTISAAEAKKWYEKNPEIRSSQIFVIIPSDSDPDVERQALKKISDALAEIKSGKISFAEAAQKYSEDPSATMGGDLDYRLKDRLDPNFYAAVSKLSKVGDITGPIRTPYGVHLGRLTGKHTWNEVDRLRVKFLILQDRRQELVNQLLDDTRRKSKVSINDKVIKQ